MIRTLYQAGGAVLAAAMFALTAAPAAQAEVVKTEPTLAELLDLARGSLTQANDVLSQVDLPGHEDTLLDRLHIQDDALGILDAQGKIQDQLLSDDDISSLTSQLLTYADQGLYHGSDAILTADQALDTAEPLTGSAATEALFGVFAADFQFLGGAFNAIFLDIASYFTSALGL